MFNQLHNFFIGIYALNNQKYDGFDLIESIFKDLIPLILLIFFLFTFQ